MNHGDYKSAIHFAEQKYRQEIIGWHRKPSESQAVTTVYVLVDEILRKTEEQETV